VEGVFVLKTNLPKRAYPLVKVMELYRRQTCVERRFRDIKGRLFGDNCLSPLATIKIPHSLLVG
jgi:hypothetical protein